MIQMLGQCFKKQIFPIIMQLLFTSRPFTIRRIKLFGLDFLLYIDQHVGRKIYLGIFEKNETIFLKQQVKNGDVCLDIGANIGYFSFMFATAAHCQVICIEPIRQNSDLIRLTASINRIGNVKVISAAVSSTVGEATIDESNETAYSALTYEDGANNIKDIYGANVVCSYKVPTISIDSLGLERLDIVKMDIEGFEYFALQGMVNTLCTNKPRLLMLELVEEHLNKFSVTVADVINLLNECGYKPKILSNSCLIDYTGQKIPQDNLFFTHFRSS